MKMELADLPRREYQVIEHGFRTLIEAAGV